VEGKAHQHTQQISCVKKNKKNKKEEEKKKAIKESVCCCNKVKYKLK